MGVSKFKFISPGVFVDETDNSQRPRLAEQDGPVIIGRSKRGPGLRPVKVDSFKTFIDIFGEPAPAGGSSDVWRDGDNTAPTYGVYAAQAWLKFNSPVTFVRLLGVAHPQAASGGEAGWATKNSVGSTVPVSSDGGGAYGLYIIPSSSWAGGQDVTGSLGAIWYFPDTTGYIRLSGTIANENTATTASLGIFINGESSEKAFTAEILSAGSVVEKRTFNFNVNSEKYIRKVFNTNPTLTNTAITSDTKSYWLGETFERHINEAFNIAGAAASSNASFGVILPLVLSGSASGEEQASFLRDTCAAETGWFFAQDLYAVTGSTFASPSPNSYDPTDMQTLFKFVALDTGEYEHSNFKISIDNIRPSNNSHDLYGSFSVILRKIDDHDGTVKIVEQYSNCNLNPNSSNYIAKKIGDVYTVWDNDERRYREYGNYKNQSKFMRVVINDDVDQGAVDASLLPFGVYGPTRWSSVVFQSGSVPSSPPNPYVLGASDAKTPGQPSQAVPGQVVWFGAAATGITFTFEYPRTYLRVSSSDGSLTSHKSAYFGFDASRSRSGQTFYEKSNSDVLRSKPAGIDSFALGSHLDYSWVFSLDDIVQGDSDVPDACWVSGSRAAGISLTAISSSYRAVLDAGFNKFTSPFYGGFNGLNIQEQEPFNNTRALSDSATELSSYAYNTVRRAIDCISDPEVVEFNLACMPGITNTSLNDYLLSLCDDRGDALAIVDLPNSYLPRTDNGQTDVRYTVSQLVNGVQGREFNTSYGCAYHPWVQIRDTFNNSYVWVPPSVITLGVFSNTQRQSQLWFAPAGFNRGGLSDGSAGLPVINVREKLTKTERDLLYQNNINPIASFPSEGIVVFGQKTLQAVPSALDRINVRRLVIYIKKQISRIANSILFDQNVVITWDRFRKKAGTFLSSVQTRLGLENFKLVLDETTTTPDLVDRNIVYAKIFLKPAKAIEFIALDFNITNNGAAFED